MPRTRIISAVVPDRRLFEEQVGPVDRIEDCPLTVLVD
jgi:hypothetical protein